MSRKEKKKKEFLSSFSICFIILIFSTLLTWIIPAGAYKTIEYDERTKSLILSSQDYDLEKGTGSQISYPAKQYVLNEFGVKASIDNFTTGNITKPISLPGTYKRLPPSHQGFFDFIASPVRGVMEAIETIIFLFMLGGVIGVMKYIGCFNSGILELTKIFKGREHIVIIAVSAVITFLGTVEGFAEETIALYPVMIPIFISAGYDGLTVAALIFMGSCVGCTFSLVNPFAVGIASYAAGIAFTDGALFRAIGLIIGAAIMLIYVSRYGKKIKDNPELSLVPGNHDELFKLYCVSDDTTDLKFTTRDKLSLTVFLLAFATMIWGVVTQGWWFAELAQLFLISGIIIGIIGGLSERQIANEFINGASDMTGVILILGFARAVSVILDRGKISGTILYELSKLVRSLSPTMFVIILFFAFIVLGYFINSSSVLGVLVIPIMAPLADIAGIPRQIIISAYLYGLGIATFLAPTGMLLPSLDLVKVDYSKWIKFSMPLLGMLSALSIILLSVEVRVSI